MKVFIFLLLFPSILLAQNSGQGGWVYVNFKPVASGISDEKGFNLTKDPFKKLLANLKPEVAGISSDLFVSFKSHDHYFAVGETGDVKISLKKNIREEPILVAEKKEEALTVSPTKKEDAIQQSDQQQIKPAPLQEVAKLDNTASNTPPQTALNVNDKNTTEGREISESTREGQSSETSSAQPQEVLPTPGEIAKAEPLTPERTLPRYHALIIGVSNYKFSGAGMVNLERPVLDAAKLKETLVNLYHFKPEDVHLMKDASRADIIDGLDDLGATLTEKDNLLIFYAGHGFWDENLQIGYWLPSDAVSTKKSSWISNSIIKDYIGGFKTKHTLLISDACFSGSIFKVREIETLSDLGTSKLYQLPSRKAMTSGNMKTVPDNSKFFEYMNKRLVENQDLYMSARQLFHNFYVAVINNTNTVPQYGVIQETGDEGGEFIFIKKQ